MRRKTHPDAAAYFVKIGRQWAPTSYGDYANTVEAATRSLLALGLRKRETVSILGFNRPEWVALDVACMAAGGAPAGIYTTCSAEEIGYIVGHAESAVVLVENEEQWSRVVSVRSRLPRLKQIVVMQGAFAPADSMTIGWQDFLSRGEHVPAHDVAERIEQLRATDLATLIYTSGTTGPPKGVMLSHENLAWTASAATELLAIGPNDSMLSYLPLSHIAEQMFSIHIPITSGSTVYFAQSLESVPEDLKEAQPTIFFGVPRVWEKFHAGVSAKLAQATGAKKLLAAWAQKVGRARATSTNPPPAWNQSQYRLANALVFKKFKAALGFGRTRVFVSGAAPIEKELLEFFAGFDVIIQEVYGQSEGSGPTSFNQASRLRFGSVGPVFPGDEIKIADDDEILLRGPNVFLGYFKDEAATKETLVDGWLRSGDLGRLDEDGFLHITGRKKEIIITAGGKNIAPKNIEGSLKRHPLIAEAVVIGDRRPYLVALLAIDPEAAALFAASKGIEPAHVRESKELTSEVQRAVDETNAQFARVEHIRKFRILARPLSIATGELTPTLKVKRNVVSRMFASLIDEMYA